ncbi:MAG: class C sortase, partial [Bifidobacterium pseudolongum]|nr:class C sortase [Bifidobacterium pseudolongum]
MRNRNSANLTPQTDRSADSSTVTPPAGSAQESTGGSLMEEQAVTKTTKKNKGGVGLNIMIVFFALVLLGGIGLIAYPTFANWWNSMHASRAVAGYVEQVNDMSAEQKKEFLDQAHAYNQKLNRLPDRWHLTDEQMDEYNKTLDITGTGIMGYITIPKLEVRLPVYHGTE